MLDVRFLEEKYGIIFSYSEKVKGSFECVYKVSSDQLLINHTEIISFFHLLFPKAVTATRMNRFGGIINVKTGDLTIH